MTQPQPHCPGILPPGNTPGGQDCVPPNVLSAGGIIRREQLREAGRRYVTRPDVKARRKAYDAKRYAEQREARKAQMRAYSRTPEAQYRRKLLNAGLPLSEVNAAVARLAQ